MTHSTDGRTLLTIANVSKAFGGVRALSDISLEVSKGEIRAIIGPNGAGRRHDHRVSPGGEGVR